MRRVRTLTAALLCSLVARAAEPADGLTYTNPPEWVAWIEGEDATRSNWVPGESRHTWWYEYAGVTGRGVLDLASPGLPAEGAFTATYEFDLPEAGIYELYWRGRYPGYGACPIYWSVNDGPERRQPAAGASHETGILHTVVNLKMVLADLGSFEGLKGRNRLTIAVRDVLNDRAVVPAGEPVRQEPYVVQAIDSLLVARPQFREPPERLPVLAAGAGGTAPLSLQAEVVPAAGQFTGAWATPAARNWAGYERLSITLSVISTAAEPFNGRLRCYYDGPSFRDLMVQVAPAEFGKPVTREFDLAKEFEGVSREGIHALWLYTYDKWYTQGGPYRVEVAEATLSARNDLGRRLQVVPPTGRPAPGLAESRARQMAEFVWNEAPRDEAGASGGAGEAEDRPEAAGVPFTAGALSVLLSPVTGGLRRLQFGEETLVDRPRAGSPLRVAWLDGTAWSPTVPGAWERDGAALVFRRGDGLVAVEWRLTGEAGELRWRPTVTNRGAQPIARVGFTLWEGVRLDGVLLASTRRYEKGTYDAVQTLVSPQAFVHDWFCLFDGRRALHGRIEDRLLLDSRARCGRPAEGTFAMIEKFPCIPPGRSWVAPDMVLGADTTGTWYDAADRYRLWFDAWAARPRVPEWFQAIGGLSVGGDVYGADAIQKNRTLLAEARDRGGVTLFHTGSWLPLLTEGWYPLNYRLDAAQLERLAAVAADLRAQGGRLSLYSNALMLSRVTPDDAAYGKELTVQGSDGFPVYTEHDYRHHPMALPWPNAEWAERFCQALAPVIGEGRPDVLYMDQLGAVPTHLDYALERHHHEHYGEWRRVQQEFCETVEKRFRPLQPELVTAIECPNIAAQQVVTFALLVHSDDEILRYTFPHFVNGIGVYASGLDPAVIERHARRAFLSGQPLLFFDCAAPGLDEAVRKRIREMLQRKRQLDPHLYARRCQTTRGIVPTAGVEGFGFVGEKEWLLTYVRTGEGTAAAVTLDPGVFGCPAEVQAYALAADGSEAEALTVQRRENRLIIHLPTAPFGVVHLR